MATANKASVRKGGRGSRLQTEPKEMRNCKNCWKGAYNWESAHF